MSRAASLRGMRQLDGGEFVMGSDRFYPEERPTRRAQVDPFWIDETPVTNRQFAGFVAATTARLIDLHQCLIAFESDNNATRFKHGIYQR